MKHTFLLLFFLPLFSIAQWSGNPGTPLRVCPTNSNQFGPWIFPDGAEGQFLFWTDYRGGGSATNMKLFAQHLDAAGNRLFPDSGKLLVDHPTKKAGFAISRAASGHFWVGFGLTTLIRLDSIVLQKFDGSTLAPLWNGYKKVASVNNTTFNVIYLESLRILPIGDSAYLQYNVTWMGGATGKFVNRISPAGEVRFGVGPPFTGNGQGGGPSATLLNPDGSLLLVQRNGNGQGTGVTAWKFDKNLNLNWGPKSLTTGTPGLGYAFEIQPDGLGGFVMAYITPIKDLMATRVDSSGNFVWTPNHKPICNFSSTQDTPDLLKVGDHFYCSWIDNRPPASNSDVFIQKLDLQGERLWNSNGRRVFRLNSYIPTPKIMADDSANIIITSFQSSTGFVAQKIRPDSSLAWPGYGMLICNASPYYPFYGSYGLSPGAGGKAFVAWKNGDQNSGQIYLAALGGDGVLLNRSAPFGAGESLISLFPNPSANGLFRLQVPQSQGESLSYGVFTSAGKIVQSGILLPNRTHDLDLREFPAGLYQLHVRSGKRKEVLRLVKE